MVMCSPCPAMTSFTTITPGALPVAHCKVASRRPACQGLSDEWPARNVRRCYRAKQMSAVGAMSYTTLANETTNNGPEWRRADLSRVGVPEEVGNALDRSALGRRATLFHDPRWLTANASVESRCVVLYSAWDGGEIVGLATFLLHRSAVPLSLGDLTLYAHRVERFNALAAPIVDGGGDHAREALLIESLLRRLREDLGPRQVVFLESVIEGSPLYAALNGGRVPGPRLFHALPNGPLYSHRVAKIPESFDAYLAQLGARSRADLRTNRKRFISGAGKTYRTRCFHTQGDVADFVADACAVSRKTYQYRLLAAGLRDPEGLERCYGMTAGLGWFRSYVLYVDDAPIAFQAGHVYAGCYFAQEIGYDPEWAPHHVGIFLHTEIVAHLATLGGAVTGFDFGNGDNLHKQRLSTDGYREGYYYLIPADLPGSVLAYSMKAVGKVSSTLGAILDRLGLRKKARDLLRRLGFSR